MTEILIVVSLILNIVVIALLFFKKSNGNNNGNEVINFIEKMQDRTEKVVKDEIARNRLESAENSKQTREESSASLKSFGDSVDKRILNITEFQNKNFEMFAQRLNDLIEKNEKRFEAIRQTLETKIEFLQKDNGEKLEMMRATVDEKLTSTLDKRLGEKFKLVSDRLEMVHRGLGEMQVLASGVGDLKKVLTNVKTRGTWGEVQLGNLLEQILSVEQYDKNVMTKKGTNDRVEFAVKFPGKDDEIKHIWLPIDSKFPIEDYQRLIEAHENADLVAVELASKAIEQRIKDEAKYIHDKYIDPPYTTDFGILYLPTEGLYAEVTQKLGLCERIQRDYRVIVTGPNTILALLNSLQMGFRTLSIEKRSSEVWRLLGTIKTEFTKFGDLLDKTGKKLDEASNVIKDASAKSRTIERSLDKVQVLPTAESAVIEDKLTSAFFDDK